MEGVEHQVTVGYGDKLTEPSPLLDKLGLMFLVWGTSATNGRYYLLNFCRK
jgi:hypothetical protein